MYGFVAFLVHHVSYASIVLTTIITRSRNGDDSLCRLLDWPHRLTSSSYKVRGIVAISGGRFETQTLMLVCSCYRQVYTLRLCLVGKPWVVFCSHLCTGPRHDRDRSCVRLSGVVLGALAQRLRTPAALMTSDASLETPFCSFCRHLLRLAC